MEDSKLNSNDGKALIKLARNAIECSLNNTKLIVDDSLKQKYCSPRGCFVTLTKKSELRGCIGYPEPLLPLWQAIIESARNAAFNDPRFPPLSKEELTLIKIEISVLTKPELLNVSANDMPKHIKIGRDGLIIEYGPWKGLLLPQVATEYGWDSITFLKAVCQKAGLDPNCWQEKDAKIYTFQAQIFSEKEQ